MAGTQFAGISPSWFDDLVRVAWLLWGCSHPPTTQGHVNAVWTENDAPCQVNV